MVKAARKYNRVVQVGTQQRSGKHFQKAMALVRDGHLGVVSQVRCMNTYNQYPKGIGNPPDAPLPPGLDWNFWLGPASWKPHNKNGSSGFMVERLILKVIFTEKNLFKCRPISSEPRSSESPLKIDV